MESSNFNLQQSIQRHISLVSERGGITGSDAAELSVHLLDATDDLVNRGLSQEEAFMIATKRLGTGEVITEAYAQVNTTLMTNKVWAYLIAGFTLISALKIILFGAKNIFYHTIFTQFGTSDTSVVIVTGFHVLFAGSIWYTLRWRRSLSYLIEQQVNRTPIRFLLGCLVIFIATMIMEQPVMSHVGNSLVHYPVYAFSSRLIEFSFYLATASLIGVMLSLVLSLGKVEALTLRSLLEKPTMPVLIIFGLLVEFLAASTRVLGMEEPMLSAVLFGGVYLLGSGLITYFNKNSHFRYLLIAFFGCLAMEAGSAYSHLEDRGPEAFYFMIMMVGCVVIGKYAGEMVRAKWQVRGPETSSG